MATENTTPESETDEDENPKSTPKPTTKTSPKPAPATRDDDLPDDPEELKALVARERAARAKVNKESADRRHRLEELERAEQERKDAQLSETQRVERETKAERQKREDAERRAEAAEKKLIDQKIDTALFIEASKRIWDYPETAAQLVNRRGIEYDEDNDKVHGVKEALDRLEKEKPGIGGSSPKGGTPPREGPRRPAAPGERDQRNPFIDEFRGSGKYV